MPHGIASSASIDSGSITASGGHVGGHMGNHVAAQDSHGFTARSALMLKGYNQGSDHGMDVMSSNSSGNIMAREAGPRGIPPIRVMSADQMLGAGSDRRGLNGGLRADNGPIGTLGPVDDDSASVEEVTALRQEVLQVLEQAPGRIAGNPALRRADLFTMDGLVAVLEWLDG